MSSLTKGLRSIDIRHWGAVPGRRGSILAVFFVLALVGVLSTTVADLTGGVCNGIAGLWLGGAVSTATRTG